MISVIYKGNNQEIDLINTPNLIITGYSGLDQPTSETITTLNPNLRGSQYQRSEIQDRTISFTFALYDVENTRYKLMKVFKSGEKGVLTLKSDFREGQIDCYFEEMTFSKFDNPTTCTIFLRSPYPYFEGLEDIVTELSNATNLFILEAYIPEEGIILGEVINDHEITISNDSDIPVGVTIEIIINGMVINPIVYNITTNEFIGINRIFINGEKLIITTGIGRKRVVVEKDGVTTNIINKIMKNSIFFNIQKGNNEIRCEATSGGENMIVYIAYREEYEAI